MRYASKVLMGLAASAMLAAIGARVEAGVINWQSIGSESGTSIVNYSGQGAYSDAGNNYWNPIAGTGTRALLATYDSSNTQVGTNGSTSAISSPTGINLLLYSPRGGAYQSNTSDPTSIAALMQAGSDVGDGTAATGFNGPGTFTISGLSAGEPYALYFYNGYAYVKLATTFTITTAGATSDQGGSSATTTGDPNAFSPFTLDTNYVTFTGTADANGDIQGTYIGVVGNAVPYGALSGIELVLTSVPEPASLTLLGLGGLGLLIRRRR